jgi:putative spermidine/putrescine transport system ATP-binding protein
VASAGQGAFALDTGVVVRVPDGGVLPAVGARGLLSLRPEKLSLLGQDETAENVAEGRVTGFAYLGAGFSVRVATERLGEIRAIIPAWKSGIAPAEGLPVRLGWAADAAVPVAEDAA